MDRALLAQSRPQAVSEAVEKAFVATSNRLGEWGVDGFWSYDFNEFGFAGSATSPSGAKPELGNTAIGSCDAHRDSQSSSGKRCDVLKNSFDRMLRSRSRGDGESLRVLDLGAGSGGWLLQAKKDLEKQLGKRPFAIHLHGVTGDALPSKVRAMKPSKVTERVYVEVAHFQQVGIETFPLRFGSDAAAVEGHRACFTGTVETVLADGQGYDLIVSSWTFCHLVDPLATLEIWSNALALHGELYVNDVDFSVLFDSECCAFTSPRTHKDNFEELSTRGFAQARSNLADVWENDPEKRMGHVFGALSSLGREDQAFSIEFVFDDKSYRTAIKLVRLSVAPIRFAPVVTYTYVNERDGVAPLLDNGGRPVYRVAGATQVGVNSPIVGF